MDDATTEGYKGTCDTGTTLHPILGIFFFLFLFSIFYFLFLILIRTIPGSTIGCVARARGWINLETVGRCRLIVRGT